MALVITGLYVHLEFGCSVGVGHDGFRSSALRCMGELFDSAEDHDELEWLEDQGRGQLGNLISGSMVRCQEEQRDVGERGGLLTWERPAIQVSEVQVQQNQVGSPDGEQRQGSSAAGGGPGLVA